MDQLQAVRSGAWKLYLPLARKRLSPFTTIEHAPAELYDLQRDLAETDNVIDQHPQVVEQLTKFAEEARADLGDGALSGKGQRPAGMVQDPQPQLIRSND